MGEPDAENDAGLLTLTDEGRQHVLPYMRELRKSMDRDLTGEEVMAWLNGWLCAEKYAANCAITGDEFQWLRSMVVTSVIPPATGGESLG